MSAPTAAAYNRVVEPLLGGILINPDLIGEIARIVVPADFAGTRSREIYAAMLACHERGEPPVYVSVIGELEARRTLAMVGEANVIDLINHCPASVYAVPCAEKLAAWGRGGQDAGGVQQSVTESLEL